MVRSERDFGDFFDVEVVAPDASREEMAAQGVPNPFVEGSKGNIYQSSTLKHFTRDEAARIGIDIESPLVEQVS